MFTDIYFEKAPAAVVMLFFFASSSFATDGYLEIGYGWKSLFRASPRANSARRL
jgi:hypothetical protein